MDAFELVAVNTVFYGADAVTRSSSHASLTVEEEGAYPIMTTTGKLSAVGERLITAHLKTPKA